MIKYRLLEEFANLFRNKQYLHRNPKLGDFVAMHLYEDLMALKRSPKFMSTVSAQVSVFNVQNKRKGVQARRGDGTLGELIPGESPIVDFGYLVARGPVATVEIGVEVKILAKAMIKQLDRVINDLTNQVREFNHHSGSSKPICVAIVGVNHANHVTSYEGNRAYRTDGKSNRHPIQEACDTIKRLKAGASAVYDEFVILPYAATNEPPYPFSWVHKRDTVQEYGAALARISREYERRF